MPLWTNRVAIAMLLSAAGLLAPGTAGADQNLQPSLPTDQNVKQRLNTDFVPGRECAFEPGPPQSQPAGRKGSDPVWNGLLIGAAIGGALGLIPDYYDDCEECHDSLYASIAVGAGVGLLVDALRGRPAGGSPPPAGDPVQITAAVGRRGLGVKATIRWK
jgi:hypothetical protein